MGYCHYPKLNGKIINNRLTSVTDVAADAQYTEDIKTQGANNYAYDAIGNLTRDLQANIKDI